MAAILVLEILFPSLNEGKNCGVFMGCTGVTAPNPAAVFRMNHTCSFTPRVTQILSSYRSMKIFFRLGKALIRSLHVQLLAWNWKPNHHFKLLKGLLMTGFNLSGCVHKKQVKLRNKYYFNTSSMKYFFIFPVLF